MLIKKIQYKLYEKIGLFFTGKYLKYNFGVQKSQGYLNERTVEYPFVMQNLLKYKSLSVLDIGTGSNAFATSLEHCGYAVTASDLKEGSYWSSFKNRHIYVLKDDITETKISGTFDAITCISVLEHIPDFNKAVKNMVSLMHEKSIMIISFPYSYDTYCENVYQLDESDKIAKTFQYIGHSFSDKEIDNWCHENQLHVVETQYVKGWSGKFWRTGERYTFPKIVEDKKDANVACFVLKKI